MYSPQIIENYQLQSGEGLSVGFVVIWLIGDLCNLSGAVMADLLPTIIIVAVYVSPGSRSAFAAGRPARRPLMPPAQYTLCDATLLAQIYYYRWKRARQGAPLLVAEDPRTSALYDEAADPLLPGDGQGDERAPKPPAWQETLKFLGALAFVFAVGVAAWAVDRHVHQGSPRSKPDEVVEWRSQILGWVSAALFRECMRAGPRERHRCSRWGAAPQLGRGFRRLVSGFSSRRGAGTEAWGPDS